MSLTRKTYDGDSSGRNDGALKWGNTVSTESTLSRDASTKRPKRAARVSDIDDELFREEGDKDRYLITYADLITLLLGLFIILYAISNIDIQKYEKMMSAIGNVFGGGANAINGEITGHEIVIPPINELNSQLQSFIQTHNLGKSLAVVENERGLVLHIFDKILFPSGSAVLNEESKELLSKLAVLIKKLPNDIRIEGHTDDIPISSSVYPSNWHLSVARALNTAYYFIDSESLNPDKVSIVGYSKYQPIATNLTPEGREKNRRVDLVIIK